MSTQHHERQHHERPPGQSDSATRAAAPKRRLAILAVTGLLALSACGQNTEPVPTAVASSPAATSPGAPDVVAVTPPKAQQVEGCASITVDLEGVAAVNGQITAPVVVLDSAGAEVFSGTASDLQALSQKFAAGSYTVKAAPLQGYAPANTPQGVTLDCDAGKAKTVVLQFKTQAQTQAAVASLGVVGDVTDAGGAALPSSPEVNMNKKVNLYASQTEEAMLVTLLVKDAAGNPVPGAAVNVATDSPSVAVVGGHVRVSSAASLGKQSLTAQGVNAVAYSDAAGLVRLTAYATSAPASGTPVKFVVTASNADGNSASGAALTEFKTFFINMSHLYYAGDTNFGAGTEAPLASKQRLGGSVGTFENNWIDPAQRLHAFRTVAYTKQPQGEATLVGGEGPFPGYVDYTVSGAGAGRVFLTDSRGSNTGGSELKTSRTAYLKTRDDVKVTDLGLNVQVRADYHYVVRFGSTDYDFLLKNYVFDKAFTGTVLDIQKTGPDILTWTGFDRADPRHDAYRPDDVTLLPSLDPAKLTPTLDDDFTVGKQYDYTIRVTNTGKTTAKNVIVRDVLPAELGFVQGSVKVSLGGAAVPGSDVLATYNAQRHAFNLSFTGAGSTGELKVGEAYDVTFKVYPRQKPGYAWNDNNRDGQTDATGGAGGTGAFGENAPRSGYYEDPYMIKNRAKASAQNAFEVDAYKDLYVVRPALAVDKSARQRTVYTNQPITFDINVLNIDRALFDPNPEVQAGYLDLKTRFPREYAEEGFAYKPRLEDTYGYNLDFVNAYDAAGNRVSTLENLGNNSLALNLPGTLKPGDTYRLSTVFQAENSVSGPGGRDGTGKAANWNCVRLYAWNLNQLPSAQLGEDSLRTLAQTPVFPPLSYQVEGLDDETGQFLNIDGQSGEFITTERGIDAQGRNYLVSCSYVRVLDKPTFDLSLFDAARGSNATTDYTVNPNRLTDAQFIPQGSYYEYDFSYVNESANEAHNVRSSMTLPSFASLNDLGVVYTHGGVNTNLSLAQVLAGVNLGGGRNLQATRAGNVITLRVNTMSAGDGLFAQFVMYANQAGSGKAMSTLDWDENTTGSPLNEDEFTRVVLR